MKFLNFNKVLCLSPHPDDVEYSMGGTVIKHTDTHFDILCLTQGGDCDETTSSSRLKEVKNSLFKDLASPANPLQSTNEASFPYIALKELLFLS